MDSGVIREGEKSASPPTLFKSLFPPNTTSLDAVVDRIFLDSLRSREGLCSYLACQLDRDFPEKENPNPRRRSKFLEEEMQCRIVHCWPKWFLEPGVCVCVCHLRGIHFKLFSLPSICANCKFFEVLPLFSLPLPHHHHQFGATSRASNVVVGHSIPISSVAQTIDRASGAHHHHHQHRQGIMEKGTQQH